MPCGNSNNILYNFDIFIFNVILFQPKRKNRTLILTVSVILNFK
jgi:hypothetical protein